MATSFFRRIFGYKKTGQKTIGLVETKSLPELLELEESLRTNIDALDEQIHEQFCLARKHGLSNKTGARKAVLKKKKLEGKVGKIADILAKIEVRRGQLESGELNTDILQARTSSSGLANQNSDSDVVQIHGIIDSIDEHLDACQDILDSISIPDTAHDEDLVNLDLDGLDKLDDAAQKNQFQSIDKQGNSDVEDDDANYNHGQPMQSLDDEELDRIVESQRTEDAKVFVKLTPRGTNEG